MECEESAEAETAGSQLRHFSFFRAKLINVQMYQCTDVPMRETSAGAEAAGMRLRHFPFFRAKQLMC